MNPSLMRTKNCGIAEISGLSFSKTPLLALQGLEAPLRHGVTWPMTPEGLRKDFDFPFVTFTGVVGMAEPVKPEFNYGQRFSDFLTENKLGTVTTCEPRKNWTGNVIQIWIWRPDYKNLWAFYDNLKVTNGSPEKE